MHSWLGNNLQNRKQIHIRIMEIYLKKLIYEGENQQLDFKYCVSDSRR